jgi:hypothetical protein
LTLKLQFQAGLIRRRVLLEVGIPSANLSRAMTFNVLIWKTFLVFDRLQAKRHMSGQATTIGGQSI